MQVQAAIADARRICVDIGDIEDRRRLCGLREGGRREGKRKEEGAEKHTREYTRENEESYELQSPFSWGFGRETTLFNLEDGRDPPTGPDPASVENDGNL